MIYGPIIAMLAPILKTLALAGEWIDYIWPYLLLLLNPLLMIFWRIVSFWVEILLLAVYFNEFRSILVNLIYLKGCEIWVLLETPSILWLFNGLLFLSFMEPWWSLIPTASFIFGSFLDVIAAALFALLMLFKIFSWFLLLFVILWVMAPLEFDWITLYLS